LSARETYAAALTNASDAPSLGELDLIASRDQGRPVGDLSAGQRRRLALAIVVARSPHVLLLDEPTNHISLALAEELEEALDPRLGPSWSPPTIAGSDAAGKVASSG